MLTQNIPKTVDGLIAPIKNVATTEKSATVLEGVSRNKNSLLNGNTTDYDWDCGKLQKFVVKAVAEPSTFRYRLHLPPARQRQHSDPARPAVSHRIVPHLAVGLRWADLQLLHRVQRERDGLGDGCGQEERAAAVVADFHIRPAPDLVHSHRRHLQLGQRDLSHRTLWVSEPGAGEVEGVNAERRQQYQETQDKEALELSSDLICNFLIAFLNRQVIRYLVLVVADLFLSVAANKVKFNYLSFYFTF